MHKIILENINKFYSVGSFIKHKSQVLNNISFSVESNEAFGIIGPNGAGQIYRY